MPVGYILMSILFINMADNAMKFIERTRLLLRFDWIRLLPANRWFWVR
ncbi:hypothetical protein DSUL_100215 [Desulfovibrionales bacterium]